MAEKSKSKAARRFGMKQMVQNVIMNIILFIIIVLIMQLGFHYYTGLRWIAVNGSKEMASELESWVENAGREVRGDITKEDVEGVVVRNVRKRASINFPENGKIRWDLVYMGSFKDSTETMVDRYELRYKFPLQVKLLYLMDFRGSFRGVASFKTQMDGPLRPVSRPETDKK